MCLSCLLVICSPKTNFKTKSKQGVTNKKWQNTIIVQITQSGPDKALCTFCQIAFRTHFTFTRCWFISLVPTILHQVMIMRQFGCSQFGCGFWGELVTVSISRTLFTLFMCWGSWRMGCIHFMKTCTDLKTFSKEDEKVGQVRKKQQGGWNPGGSFTVENN